MRTALQTAKHKHNGGQHLQQQTKTEDSTSGSKMGGKAWLTLQKFLGKGEQREKGAMWGK